MKESAKYVNIVNAERMGQLRQEIEHILVYQKKYKDKDFSCRRLAAELQVNTRYVSVVLREAFGMNYSQLVNHLRIEEAKVLLHDPEMQQLRMEDVGDMVGFLTRQSFQLTFSRMVGMTPLQYRNHERRI